MIALFVALGIAVVTLLALLLWFVPHLLQQQALRSANESARLRDMLLDMLNQQEAVTMRQSQLGTSIAYLQDKLEQLIEVDARGGAGQIVLDDATLQQLEERMSLIQGQIQVWMENGNGNARARTKQDNESWAYLLSLLAAIQDRVGVLSADRTNATIHVHASALLEELEQEMQHLHNISEDIAKLQWRLRRSLNERETSVSLLRTRAGSGTNEASAC